MSKINLYDLGLSEKHLQEAAMADNLYMARVSAQYKDMYKVITEEGEIHAEVSGKLGFSAGAGTAYPAVGDWVLVDRIEERSGNAIIHHILSRKSSLERKAAGTANEHQIIAVNIDTVFICMSLNNDYNLRRIERYLAIVWDSMAIPVIILTKSDLCDDLTAKLREVENVAPGVDIVVTSSMTDDGYKDILKYVRKGKTIAFIGSSGVGKSTLINKLCGQDVLATRETRADDKGRHTTTTREMILLPGGGIVIDTPGMRELQIAGADFSRSFADIEELAEMCRFKDCRHESEPGCAVRGAVEDGTLSADRLENYKKLQKEMLFEERKRTMTAAQAEKLKIIDMMGSLKGPDIQKLNRKK